MRLSVTLAHWRALRDVPTTATRHGPDVIDVPYMHFPVGTDIEDVWRWLESECDNFSVGDAMSGKYAS